MLSAIYGLALVILPIAAGLLAVWMLGAPARSAERREREEGLS